jgi:iron complex transport system substrate-binding protein
MRIVSILPSATEIVCLLGLADDLCGVTHECDYPPSVRGKRLVVRSALDTASMDGGRIDSTVKEAARDGRPLHEVDVDALRELQPDLVITHGLCDVCAVPFKGVERLVAGLPSTPRVLSLNPHRLADVLDDIVRVGEATGRGETARREAEALRHRIEAVRAKTARSPRRPNVACLEWLDPLMTAGHWVPQMVALAGAYDVLTRPGYPSRRVAWDEVQAAKPDAVVLMPCGFGVERTRMEAASLPMLPGWRDLPAVETGNVWAVDANSHFSRSGPRLVDGLELLAAMLHPELFPAAVAPHAAQRFSAP